MITISNEYENARENRFTFYTALICAFTTYTSVKSHEENTTSLVRKCNNFYFICYLITMIHWALGVLNLALLVSMCQLYVCNFCSVDVLVCP